MNNSLFKKSILSSYDIIKKERRGKKPFWEYQETASPENIFPLSALLS